MYMYILICSSNYDKYILFYYHIVIFTHLQNTFSAIKHFYIHFIFNFNDGI